MSIQPGVGYTFTSSSLGTTLNIEQPWTAPGASGPGLQILFDYNQNTNPLNHWQAVVSGTAEDYRLQVAWGGNIYREPDSACDREKLCLEIIVADSITLVPLIVVNTPFMELGSYVPLDVTKSYYVYAFKFRTAYQPIPNIVCYITDTQLTLNCPIVLPSEILAIYPDTTGKHQGLLVAEVNYLADLQWHSWQHILGSIAWPQDPSDAEEQSVDHYEVQLQGIVNDSSANGFFKVASGGNIYRTLYSDCDKQKLADDVYVDAALGQSYSNTSSGGNPIPWSNNNGHMALIVARDYYIYAVRLESDEGSDFYIYISGTSNLHEQCPQSKPAEIPLPTGVSQFKVHILQVAHIQPANESHEIYQKLIGSITWPIAEVVEQFQVRVINVTQGEVQGPAVQVAMGRVLNRCADLVTGSNNWGQTYVSVVALNRCLKQWDVKGWAVYPDDSLQGVGGGFDPWASEGGFVMLPDAPSTPIGIYLVLNNFDATSNESGAPYLALITEDNDDEAYVKSRPYNDCDSVLIQSGTYTWEIDVGAAYAYVFVNGGSYNYIQNYNCQRVKIAILEKIEGTWFVEQHLIGTLTIPDPFQTGSNFLFKGSNPTQGNLPIASSQVAPPIFASENTAWNGAWAGYTKDFPASTVEIPI